MASQIEGKLVKPIANLSRERSPMLPALATAQEQGLGDFDASTWFGFFVPQNTPVAVIQKLHDATVEAMDTPSVQERLKEVGAMTVAPERRSPAYLQQFVASEIEKNAAPAPGPLEFPGLSPRRCCADAWKWVKREGNPCNEASGTGARKVRETNDARRCRRRW